MALPRIEIFTKSTSYICNWDQKYILTAESMEPQGSFFDLQHHCTNNVKISANKAIQDVFFKKKISPDVKL